MQTKYDILIKIDGILNKYQFEFNNSITRRKICNDLSLYLNRNVFDNTKPEMLDRNEFDFLVEVGKINYDLLYYIDNKEIIERTIKINKIKLITKNKN